jgi:parvulin-like peptidyl-prolyl isomerase
MTIRIAAIIAFALGASPLFAQVAPPPPAAVQAPATKNLAPVRKDQSITLNALVGFVNSEPIFVHDLIRPIDEQLRGFARDARNLNEFRNAARNAVDGQLRTTVSNILILSNAKAALTEDDKGKIEIIMNKERANLLAKHGGSRAIADQQLKAEGSSVDKFLADVRRRLTVQLYLSKKIYPRIVVTRQMVLDEYNRDPKKWQEEAEVELFTITLPITRWLPREPSENGEIGQPIKNPTPEQKKAAQTAALAEAIDITNQLKASKDIVADFARLAEDKNSVDGRKFKGGRTPNVKRGSRVSKKEEDFIFSLPANTLGRPIIIDDPDITKSRVEVIRVGEKKEGRSIPFTEAQAAITKELQNQQYDKLSNQYMQELYNAAKMEGIDMVGKDALETALEVAVARYATQ